MEDISIFVKEGVLRVFAKPGKRKTRFLGYDHSRDAIVIEVDAPAEDNKANLELIRFLSKALKRPVTMKSGFASKHKVFKIS